MKLFLPLLLMLSANSYAVNVYSDQFQRIHSTELVELVEDVNGNEVERKISDVSELERFDLMIKNSEVVKVNAKGILMMTKSLIALGKEVYKIVEAGKPVITVSDNTPVSVLPRDGESNYIDAMGLSSWSAPKVKKYRVKVKNYLGVSAVSLDFMLIFSYGGQYNGSGKYLTGAQIKTTNVDVKWGYNLNVDFKVETIMNQGTDENPLAGVVLSLNYDINTVLQGNKTSKTFFINGLGHITEY